MSNWARHRAARVVASRSADAAEAVVLLDMLGVTAAEGRCPAADPIDAPPPARVDRDAARAIGVAMVAEIRRVGA